MKRSIFAVFSIFFFLGLQLPSQAAPPEQANKKETGIPSKGDTGTRETTTAIMERQALTDLASKGKAKKFKIKKEKESPERDLLPQNPASPHVAQWVPSQSTPDVSQPPSSEAPQSLGVSFTGATLADTFSFPPDTMGAVGPTQFIVFVNGRLRSFNKTTGVADGVLNADPDVFFASVRGTSSTTDPRIRYDRLTGRWILIIINDTTVANRVLIAVSDSGIVTGSTVWTFFFFTGPGNRFADYPTLGVDNNALYIGANLFTSAGSYANTAAFVVRKSSVLGAGPIVVTHFTNLLTSSTAAGIYTPQGVDNFDPAATEGYFIGSDNASYGLLVVRRVTNPAGTPSLSGNLSITVPSTAAPATVPHLGNTGGTSGNLDGLDDRLLAAHIRNGRLWTAHNIQVNSSGVASASGGRDAVRWYELQNLSGTPTVVQSGTLFDPAGSNPLSFWMGTVMVSGQGHVALGCSTAGAAARINAATAGRLATDTLGTLQSFVNYTASSTAYNPASDPGGTGGRRWGDYSYTCLDPGDDMTMWTIQQFCDAANSYGVRAIKLLAPPPATPVSANPASAMQGASNLNITIAGTSTSGSGFFDPGVGFSNRLAAVVNGGSVTVNSVTYSNPTNITLNITIAANAPTGARTVTVTNPDGQPATSGSGLLTIASSNPMPVIMPYLASLTAESCLPTNGRIDPAETVTVSFSVLNTGTSNTINLVATLLATNGVTAPSGPQSYGVVVTNGPAISQSFTFTATGACGGTFMPTLQLQDGATNLGTITYTLPLGQIATPLSQNFDGVTAPALPAGWNTSSTGGQSNWVTSITSFDTSPNAAFSADNSAVGVNELGSPSIVISSTNAQLSFRQNYSLTASTTNSAIGYDGGVLEIKIGAGSFTDILAAGGSFASGGYNTTLSGTYGNPLAGRQAWSGNSGGFTTTVVTLPASAAGQNVQLRWRCATGTAPVIPAAPLASSGTMAYWSFDQTNNVADVSGANLTVSTLTNANTGSAAVTYVTGNPNRAISSTDWSTLAGPPTTSYSCYTFSVTVASGYQLNLSSLSFDDRASGTGPATFAVQISTNSFASALYDSGGQSTHANFTTNPMNTLALSASGLTGTVSFRIYAYGATAAGGTWRIDNVNLQGGVDSIGSGGWYIDSIFVTDPNCCTSTVNQPPVINAANISPSSPTTTNDLLAVVTSVSDPESNPVSFAYQWQESTNNTAFANLGGQTMSSLTAPFTIAGYYYQVIITPNDGLTNGLPFTTSSVLVPLDADGNGLNDDWEVQNFGHIAVNPNADPDGDGLTNAQEETAGTNPNDASSFVRITDITRSGADVIVTFAAVSGKSYELQRSTSMQPTSWQTVGSATAGGVSAQITDAGAASLTQIFYRVRALP